MRSFFFGGTNFIFQEIRFIKLRKEYFFNFIIIINYFHCNRYLLYIFFCFCIETGQICCETILSWFNRIFFKLLSKYAVKKLSRDDESMVSQGWCTDSMRTIISGILPSTKFTVKYYITNEREWLYKLQIH